jgi:UDP-glucuronate 4-epimerase
MKVLVTGCAGFLGYHICDELLKNNNSTSIIGVDSINDYYSQGIKKKRLKDLKKNKNFLFYKIDISNEKKLKKIFNNHKFEIIIHLAAQAGVRHALKDPESYLDSNIKGFLNLIDNLKTNSVKKFIFASSSSVYGEGKKFPQSEEMKPKPINIYSSTKLLNEEIIRDYSNISKIKFIGLRFFTIYGSHGRPDMFLFKLLKSIFKKNSFYLNNYGNHLRDFTHVDDVKMIIKKLIDKKIKTKFQIFNVCSNNPISILRLISDVSKITSTNPKIVKVKRHKADVLKTHGSNIKIKKYLNIKIFRNIFEELLPIVNWYRDKKFYKF